jgi:hypothetical protein
MHLTFSSRRVYPWVGEGCSGNALEGVGRWIARRTVPMAWERGDSGPRMPEYGPRMTLGQGLRGEAQEATDMGLLVVASAVDG